MTELNELHTFFIGDTHFHHENIIGYEDRPFENADKMNWAIVKNWNSVVQKDDKIFLVGDVGFSKQDALQRILTAMNGRKYLIKGNHDHHSNQWYRDVGFDNVYEYPIIIEGFLILSHEPVYLEKKTPYRNIHGHTHSIKMDDKRFLNVSVECINYTPISLAEVKKILNGCTD